MPKGLVRDRLRYNLLNLMDTHEHHSPNVSSDLSTVSFPTLGEALNCSTCLKFFKKKIKRRRIWDCCFLWIISQRHEATDVFLISVGGVGGMWGGLTHSTTLVICQCISFDGKVAGSMPVSQWHTGMMGLWGFQRAKGEATRKTP